MIASPEVLFEVLRQIRDLSDLEVDRRYENPNDTALAVFLLLVTLVDTDYAFITADLVDRAQQCWYAKHIARRILTPYNISSSNTRPSLSHTMSLSDEMSIVLNPATLQRKLSFHRKANTSENKESDIVPEVLNWR